MAKGLKAPSKVQIAKDDRRWRAECMVKDAMQATPQFKQAVRAAEREIAKSEIAVKKAIQKGK